MKFWNSGSASPARESSPRDVGQVTTMSANSDGGPDSIYTGALEFNALETPETSVTPYAQAQARVPAHVSSLRLFTMSSRRIAIASTVITFVVLIIAMLILLSVMRVGKKNTSQTTNGGSVTIDIASQDVTVPSQNSAITAPEISSKSGALLINGDIIGRGDLQLTNGSYVTVLKPTTLTSNQLITLPDASGTICLDSNNCNFATQADLQATNAQLGQTSAQLAQLRGQLGQIVIPATPVTTTLNGAAGALSIQGTSNQISVTTVNGVISLAAPQDIAPISSPTFAGLLLTGNFAVNGTVTLPLNCTGNLNGGALTTDGAGTIVCSDDDDSSGGGGAVTTPGGTAGTVPMFTAAQTIADSLISQAVGTVTIGGNAIVTGSLSANALTLTTALSVPNGGTGAISFTANGVVVGNGAGALATTAAPAGGQVLLGNAGGVPTFTALTGDVAVTGAGVTSIQANSIALGVDTTGDYVQNLGALTGLSVAGNAGEGSTPTLSVVYGSTANSAVEGNTTVTLTAGNGLSGGGVVTLGTGGSATFTVAYGAAANTAVQGNVTLTCPAGAGNLTGGGNTITLGTGGSCNQLTTVNNPTFTTSVTTASLNITGAGATGTLQVANLGQATTYTLPDPGAGTATICLSTGNCAGAGGGVTTSGGTTDRLSKFTGSNSIGDSVISDNGSVVAITGTANLVVQGGNATLGTLTQSGTLLISDGSSNTVSIVASGLAGDRTYTLPDAGGPADFCLSTGNCVGGAGGGAPNTASYLVASLDGTLTNERALAAGSNISITDGGANANMTVATVQNPTFTTSVTTPLLQSSNVLTITSAAGNIIAVDAGTTIELQDSTNVTGDLDASGTFTAGTGNAFQINSSGAISAATGITSSGTIRFSGYNCTANANGGKLTTDGSGNLTCADDNGGAGSAISGSGTNGTIPLFNGAQTITDSVITQSGSTITITGDLLLTTDLTVANGGTGASTFTSNGVLYGNGAGAIQATAAGTSGQVLVANASGVPTFVSFSNDVTVTDTGVVTIANDAVTSAKIDDGTITGTDIANATVANSNLVNSSLTVTAGNGLTGGGSASLGGSTSLAVAYGSAANTAVQGNTTLTITAGTGLTGGSSITLGAGGSATLDVTYGSALGTAVQGSVQLTCPSGTGNLSGGGTTITLGTGGSCGNLSIVNNPTFTTSVTTPSLIFTGAGSNGTVQIANLGQATAYTIPDPGAGTATFCLSSGNCAAAGSAGGDLTGNYPNPTIAKLQGGDLDIVTPTAGHVLIYNGTNSAWENHNISSDVTITETGVATIANDAVTSAKIANGTVTGTDIANNTVANSNLVNSSLSVTAGTGLTGGGAASLGGSTTLNVSYGSSAGTAVEGNTSISVAAGSNLSGGGSITLGAGGTVTLDVTNSPNFSGTLVAQGATVTVGAAAQQGSLVLNDGSANTGTVQTAALGQNTVFTLPDPGAGTATICLSTGNCAGTGGGVTTAGGTTNRVSKFTGSSTIGDSSISDDGSIVTINGTANLVIQGGNATLGTTTQSGTLNISDGSSNTVSIVAAAFAADQTYTIPDVASSATFCMSTGNCVGGAGGAPNAAAYLVATLDGTLSNERALAAGSNISITDGGANANMTVATVQNPTFTTSVTTPLLQSSGALTITSAAGQIIAIDAGTTIELQDSTNITGNLDASGTLTAGGSNAFQVNSSGAITAATGIISSGTVRLSSYNCSTNANGGKLTTDGSGNLICDDDNGGSGTGSTGTIPVFTGSQTIADSVITQSGSAITITGTLSITNALGVASGGTGATTLASNGVLYGNGSGAIQATTAGTGGQVLIANGSGVPTFVSFSNDVTVSNTGAVTIANDAVTSAKIDDGTITGTDIANATVDNSNLVNSSVTVSAGNGLSGGGAASLGGSTSLAVVYGSAANTAVQGNTGITVTAGSNLSGGGSITLGAGGTVTLDVASSPVFSGTLTVQGATATIGTAAQQGSLVVNDGSSNTGTLTVAALGQNTVYTLPDPGAGTATICLSSGNCVGGGGGGSAPNAATYLVASLDGTLTNERALAAGSNISITDGGANANMTVATVQNPTFTTSVTTPLLQSSAGLTVAANAGSTLTLGESSNANSATDIYAGSTGGINLNQHTTVGSGKTFDVTNGLTTLGGGLTVDGGTVNINATGTAATTIGNTTGTLALQGGGTVTLGSSNGTNGTNLTFFNTQTAGNINYQLDRSVTAGNYEICTTAVTTACTTAYNGGSSTLQQAYDNDADGSDSIIALTTADDSIILRNPAASGTDSTYVLTIDQLATGATGGLDIQSAGTGTLLRVRDTTATAADVLTIADGGAATFKSQTNSTTAFQIQNSGASPLFLADTSGGHVVISGSSSITGSALEVQGKATVGFVNGSGAFDVRNSGGALSIFNVDTNSGTERINVTGDQHFADGGNRVIKISDQTTSNTAGNNLTVISGAGNGTGAGGTMTLQAGASGTGATGNGGALAITGGSAVSTNGSGGAVTISGGAKTGSGTVGAVNINTGASTGAVNIGNSAAGAIAVQSASTIGLTGTTSITGLSSGQALTVTNASTGGIASFYDSNDGTNPVLSIADEGAMVFQNNTDSATAYLFKKANGTTIFSIDSTNSRVGTSNVSSAATNSQALVVRTGDATGSGASGSGDITLRSGNSINSSSGNIDLEVGAGSTFGDINIGANYRANAINIGQVAANAIQSTVNIATSTNGTQTVNLGSSSVAGNATTIRGGSTGGINLIGVTNINTSGTAATSVGNTTGSLTLQGGSSVSLASSNGTNATTIGFVNSQTAGNIAYNFDRSVAAGTYEICTTATTTACTTAYAPTLQQGYNNDGNGSDTIVALTANDDSLIFRNPAASGTDSSYVLTIDQLATGATGGLSIQSAGTGNLLLVTDTTATARNVLTIANGGATTFRNQTDSATAFQVQDALGNAQLIVDTATGGVGIGMAPTGATLDVAGDLRVVHPSFVGSYLTLEGTGSNQFLEVNNNGWFNYHPISNANVAFEVREETDTYPIFGIDTTNGRVAVGRNQPTATLHVQAFYHTETAAYITGANSSQTGDLLQVAKEDGAADVLSVAANGATLFRNNADSTTAFQVQNAAGARTLVIDTSNGTNGRVGIGLSSSTLPSADLTFGSGVDRIINILAQTLSNTAGNNLTINSAAGNGTGNGGVLTLQAGASGSGATGNAGSINVFGGDAASTDGFGGDLVLRAGYGNGTGDDGNINMGTLGGGNISIGSVNAGALNMQSGALGGINLYTSSATEGTVVKTVADSVSGFVVRDSTNTDILRVDTTSGFTVGDTIQAAQFTTAPWGSYYANGYWDAGTSDVRYLTNGALFDWGTDGTNFFLASAPSGLANAVAAETNVLDIRASDNRINFTTNAQFNVRNATSEDILSVDATTRAVINNGTSNFENMLENPGFELGVNPGSGDYGQDETGWRTSGANANIQTDANAHTGNNVYRITTHNVDINASKYYAVQPGDVIYYSGYVKNTGGGNRSGGFFVEASDEDLANQVFDNSGWTNPGSSYTLRTGSYTVPAGKYYIRIAMTVRNDGTTTGTWYYDDLYLSRANNQAPSIFRNQTDSTTAFQIQNAAGTSLFNADTTNTAITVNGSLTIGKRTDSGGGTGDWTKLVGTAGTVCGQSAVNAAKASVVFNGSLYIGTTEQDKAEICRYDGGTTWTRVNSAAGTFGSDTNTDSVGTMIAYNGTIYVGTTGGNTTTGAETNRAAVYRWDGGTTFTLLNTLGTLDAVSNIDGISAMAVFQGALFLGTTDTAANAGIYAYHYGGGFVLTNAAAGQLGGTAAVYTTVSSLQVANIRGVGLFAGLNAPNAGTLAEYDVNGWFVVKSDNGGIAGTIDGEAGIDEVNSLVVWNGSLYFSAAETGTGNKAMLIKVYRDSDFDDAYYHTQFIALNTTHGTIGSTSAIDRITSLTVYNGVMYVGTKEANKAELYTTDGFRGFTKVSQAAGQLRSGDTASIDGIVALQQFGDDLYVLTEESDTLEVYKFSAIEGQSQRLNFNATTDNAGSSEQSGFPAGGSIYYQAEQSSSTNIQNSSSGQFVFTSNITTNAGSYDIAEDYPTRDDSLTFGDIVSLDPNEAEFVTRTAAGQAGGIVGVYSTKPALRLSQKDVTINGGRAIPVALAGRVPVKVSTENGPIMPGDAITISPTQPGVGVKAVSTGRIVGMAMDGWSGTGVGKITVFVNPNYYSGGLQGDVLGGNLTINGTLTTQDITVTGVATAQTLVVTGNATVQSLTVTQGITTGSLTVTGTTKLATLTVSGDTTLGTVTVTGHVITAGDVPEVAALAAAGQGATVTIDGNDTAGTITIVAGSADAAAGELAHITFDKQFAKAPRVVLSAAGRDGAGLQIYAASQQIDGFVIGAGAAPANTQTYVFNYFVIQ